MSAPRNDIITRFVDDLVARVVSGIGEKHVRSVFVGGSVAVGEELLCRVDDVFEIYSDVDLYVVVDDAVDLQGARRLARELTGATPLAGPGFRFFRAPDVGVYTFGDLASQPARPGTVGLDRCHLMLYGDASLPLLAAQRIGARIAAREALYLLENRLGELAAVEQQWRRTGSGVSDGYYAFAVCKTALDAAGASFIVRGDYDTRRSQRVRKLTTLSEPCGRDGGWSSDALDVVRRCGARLDSMMKPDCDERVDRVEEAQNVVSLVLDRWKVIASAVLEGDVAGWDNLVLRRCRIGDYLGNFRQFRAVNARCGFKRRGAIAAGVHLSRYSPVDALRVAALMDYLSRHEAEQPDVHRLVNALGSFLDRLTHECGFTDGSLLQRAIDMNRAIQ
jgi:hypothetical protein